MSRTTFAMIAAFLLQAAGALIIAAVFCDSAILLLLGGGVSLMGVALLGQAAKP